MKFLTILFILFFNFNNILAKETETNLKNRLSTLKKQTVEIHNTIIENNNELKKINLDIQKNKQQQIIFRKYIKDKEDIAKRIVFLMQEKIYISTFNSIIKSLTNKSDDYVTNEIVRNFYLDAIKRSINNFFLSLEGVDELKSDLYVKHQKFKKKKKSLNLKLNNLEKKISEVAFLQKKIQVDRHILKNEKKLKKKAKNINDLVQGVRTKKKIKRKKLKKKKYKKTNIQMPVQGKIISDFGEGKDLNNSKYGLVFSVSADSFVTSPIDGIVLFAGKWRSYGNIVIIENETNFQTILTGMHKILISTGNKVLRGEPIARISEKADDQLYFEMRYKGKIIDPKTEVEIL